MKKDVKILPIAIPLEKRMEDFKQYLDSSSRIVFSAVSFQNWRID